jgi:hypothetical protein
MDPRTPLTNYNRAGMDILPAERLNSKTLALAIPTVTGTADSFFVSHLSTPRTIFNICQFHNSDQSKPGNQAFGCISTSYFIGGRQLELLLLSCLLRRFLFLSGFGGRFFLAGT